MLMSAEYPLGYVREGGHEKAALLMVHGYNWQSHDFALPFENEADRIDYIGVQMMDDRDMRLVLDSWVGKQRPLHAFCNCRNTNSGGPITGEAYDVLWNMLWAIKDDNDAMLKGTVQRVEKPLAPLPRVARMGDDSTGPLELLVEDDGTVVATSYSGIGKKKCVIRLSSTTPYMRAYPLFAELHQALVVANRRHTLYAR
jgi:hypothetical protein